jgi:hypothetical protein
MLGGLCGGSRMEPCRRKRTTLQCGGTEATLRLTRRLSLWSRTGSGAGSSVEFCRVHDYTALRLETLTRLTAAFHLYESLGFVWWETKSDNYRVQHCELQR